VASESLERERGDEFTGGSGHNRMHFMTFFDELRCEVGGLVSSDGASDAEDDFHLNFKLQN
jgi:hypothetical protein